MKVRVVTQQEDQSLRLTVYGIHADFIDRYNNLLRPDYDDKILKDGCEAWSWLPMRIFKIVWIDSRNPSTAKETCNEITHYILQRTSHSEFSETRRNGNEADFADTWGLICWRMQKVTDTGVLHIDEAQYSGLARAFGILIISLHLIDCATRRQRGFPI